MQRLGNNVDTPVQFRVVICESVWRHHAKNLSQTNSFKFDVVRLDLPFARAPEDIPFNEHLRELNANKQSGG